MGEVPPFVLFPIWRHYGPATPIRLDDQNRAFIKEAILQCSKERIEQGYFERVYSHATKRVNHAYKLEFKIRVTRDRGRVTVKLFLGGDEVHSVQIAMRLL